MAGFFANMLLLFYVLRKASGEKLNRLYALFAFSMAVWSLGNALTFAAPDAETAFYFEKVSTVGSTLVPPLLLHFFLVFTKNRLEKSKKLYLIYAPAFLFELVNMGTDLISGPMEMKYWGYAVTGGILYLPAALYIVLYVFAGLLICYRFRSRAPSTIEKIQTKLLIISVSIPLAGGILTETIIPAIEFEMIPLTSMLSTLMAVIIAYAMTKHRLMAITPEIAADKIISTMADYLVIADREKRIALVSDSTPRALGYEKGEIVGKPLSVIFKRRGLDSEITGEIERSDYLENREARISTKDGKTMDVSINGSLMKDSGSLLGYVLVMRDVTEINKLVKDLQKKTGELEKSKEELESKVKELERFNRISVGRELRMIELKKKIKELKEKLEEREQEDKAVKTEE